MSFVKDLKEGNDFEVVAKRNIEDKLWIPLIHNPNKKWIDLLIQQEPFTEWIEIKLDRYARRKSWNFYIELASNGKPSWIFKNEEHKLAYWGHSDWHTLFLVEWKKLVEDIQERVSQCLENKTLKHKDFRVVEKWGDWWRTRWLLMPVSYFREIATHVLDLDEKFN